MRIGVEGRPDVNKGRWYVDEGRWYVDEGGPARATGFSRPYHAVGADKVRWRCPKLSWTRLRIPNEGS